MDTTAFDHRHGAGISLHRWRLGQVRRRRPSGCRRRLLLALLLALGLAPLAIAAPPVPPTASAATDGTQTYTAQGTCQPPYHVPPNVYLIHAVLIGGHGASGTGGNTAYSGGSGGQGAEVIADIPVQPGESLGVDVGENGDNTTPAVAGDINGVTGGGQGGIEDHVNPLQRESNGGWGGGASDLSLDVFHTGCSNGIYASRFTNPLAVAGGGGGGGGAGTTVDGARGGDAGNDYLPSTSAMNGEDGHSLASATNGGGGHGATASAGGRGGSGHQTPGLDGSRFLGGLGGAFPTTSPNNSFVLDGPFDGGGGGGGGYYGGGGGGEGNGGGGGGGGAGSSVVLQGYREQVFTTASSPMVAITPLYSPPASLFTVAAGNGFTCALTPSQTITCWGDNTHGQATPPAGTFTSLSASLDVACGVKTDQTLACWGNSAYGQTTVPAGQFHQVSAGGGFACGLRVDATITCWGSLAPIVDGQGLYTSISAGDDYVCALDAGQHARCFSNTNLVPDTTPATDQFTQISASMYSPCGLRTDGTSVCWGGSSYALQAPSGTFSALSSASGSGDMCWIASDGTLQCATTGYGWTLPPPNGALLGDTDPVRLGISFSTVSMGANHACGVLTNHIPGDLFLCWGSGDDSQGEVGAVIPNGQANPYDNAVLAPATVGQPYRFQFTSTYMWPAPTYALAPSSGVPPGLTIDPASGLLSGTPTTPGQYLFAVSADNGVTPGYGSCNGPTGACDIVQLQVVPALAFTSPSSATFAVGTAGAVTVSAQGSATPALSETGALPAGVTFTDNGDGTATVSGAPARGAGGVYPLTLTAHNGAQPDATQSFTLTVTNPAPTTSSLTPASVQAGGAGGALTIAGTNFVPGSQVVLTTAGGTSTTLTPSAVSADGTSLTVTLPAAAIAQAGTLQVQVVNAAPGGGTSTVQPLFVTAATAAVASESVSRSGTASTGGTGAQTPGSVTVSGSGGSGTVAVALYRANPGTTPSFAASSAYFDAYVAPGSTYSSVQIADCDLTAGSVALWYDAATATWVQASQQSYDATTHCTTITVTASTTPSLAQLGGTPFAIADDPLLTLDEQGLPGSVPHQATLDGQTVALPDSGVAVPYHSSHSYSFPALVIDGSSGTVYFTSDPGFSGPVTANITDTAVYQTMAQLVGAALSSGGIYGSGASGQATALTQQFAAVQADLKAGHTGQALSDVQSFAAHVQAQAGKHLTTATAQALLADAQLVYAHLGGSGTV